MHLRFFQPVGTPFLKSRCSLSPMLSLHPGAWYFAYQGYVNMLKSFNGCGIVTNELHRDLLTGDVFIFFNKRRSCIKVLAWESDGFSIYYKRLQKGTFEFSPDETHGKGALMVKFH